MKKTALLLFPILFLVSCNSTGIDSSKVSGVIDCRSVSITDGGSSIFNGYYSESFSYVYEYKAEDNSCIYVSQHDNYSIRVFNKKYSEDFLEYTFSAFVGYLKVENTFLLDLDNKILDVKTKYLEYTYSNNSGSDLKYDNSKAYKLVKKFGYYIIDTFNYYSSSNLYSYEYDAGLVKDTYIKISSSSTIIYTSR